LNKHKNLIFKENYVDASKKKFILNNLKNIQEIENNKEGDKGNFVKI